MKWSNRMGTAAINYQMKIIYMQLNPSWSWGHKKVTWRNFPNGDDFYSRYETFCSQASTYSLMRCTLWFADWGREDWGPVYWWFYTIQDRKWIPAVLQPISGKISERHHEEIFTVGRTLGGTYNHTFCLEEKWPDVKLFADSWGIVNGLDK